MDGMLAILRLINALGVVEGRKKLQKIVYILQAKGYAFPQHFGYLHYGPYASGLASEVNALVSSRLIIEDGGGEEYEPYTYRPAPAAKTFLRELRIDQSPAWLSLAKDLNAKDANYLEALSTLLYLQSNGFRGTGLKERFVSLKPNLKGYFAEAHKEAIVLRPT
jgi:uncharacterized protein